MCFVCFVADFEEFATVHVSVLSLSNCPLVAPVLIWSLFFQYSVLFLGVVVLHRATPKKQHVHQLFRDLTIAMYCWLHPTTERRRRNVPTNNRLWPLIAQPHGRIVLSLVLFEPHWQPHWQWFSPSTRWFQLPSLFALPSIPLLSLPFVVASHSFPVSWMHFF